MPQDHADPWRHLARWTPARIALGRAGSALPTQEILRFALAHAQARDAVHAPVDWDTLVRQLPAELGQPVRVSSRAVERALYLRRPDLGRRLDEASALALQPGPQPAVLVIVIGDGLSAPAVNAHATRLVTTLAPRLQTLGLSPVPVVLAQGARVALGDEIGERLGARVVAMLIGERPGLSSPDSLGVYLTYGPRRGRTDADRNCISNIRGDGLSYDLAAFKLAWLLREALCRKVSGVPLKDESEALLSGGDVPHLLPGPA